MKFENGTLVKGAYVTIDGVDYEVHMPEYSGNTPLSAETFNKMQEDLKEELQEVVLFEDASGSTGDITLSESAANFKYLEIFYKRYSTAGEYGTPCKSEKINNPNGKYGVLNMNYPGGDILQISAEEIQINGTKIIRYSDYLMLGVNITNGQIIQYEKTTHFLIDKVIGFKEQEV